MNELEGYKSIKFWRGRIGSGTYKTYMAAFRQFMKWLKREGGSLAPMDPDGLIDYQKNTDNGTRFDILDLVQTWSQGLSTPEGVDWRLSSKHGAYSAVRSFFTHNRAGLPRDAYKFRSETEPSKGLLTIKNITDTALASRPMYRAVFLSMFQGALDIQSLQYWNEHGWEDLQEDLKGNPEIIKISLPGRKNNRNPFCTFVGGDAIHAIRTYIPARPTREEAQDKHERDEARRGAAAEEKGVEYKSRPFYYAIFYTQFKTPISRVALQHYWIDRLEDLGLVHRLPGRGQRYGMNLHELRDVFRSQWEKSPAKASVAEFCMGHKIDPLGYNKAHRDEDWVSEEYLQALPMLEIMSSDTPYNRVDARVVKKLQDKVAELEASISLGQRAILEALVDPEKAKKYLKLLELSDENRKTP